MEKFIYQVLVLLKLADQSKIVYCKTKLHNLTMAYVSRRVGSFLRAVAVM